MIFTIYILSICLITECIICLKSEEKDESVENGTEEVIEGDQNEKGGMKRKADSEESAEAAPKKKQKKKSKEKKSLFFLMSYPLIKHF